MTTVFFQNIVPRTYAKIGPLDLSDSHKMLHITWAHASFVHSKYHWDTLRIGRIIAVEKQKSGMHLFRCVCVNMMKHSISVVGSNI